MQHTIGDLFTTMRLMAAMGTVMLGVPKHLHNRHVRNDCAQQGHPICAPLGVIGHSLTRRKSVDMEQLWNKANGLIGGLARDACCLRCLSIVRYQCRRQTRGEAPLELR